MSTLETALFGWCFILTLINVLVWFYASDHAKDLSYHDSYFYEVWKRIDALEDQRKRLKDAFTEED